MAALRPPGSCSTRATHIHPVRSSRCRAWSKGTFCSGLRGLDTRNWTVVRYQNGEHNACWDSRAAFLGANAGHRHSKLDCWCVTRTASTTPAGQQGCLPCRANAGPHQVAAAPPRARPRLHPLRLRTPSSSVRPTAPTTWPGPGAAAHAGTGRTGRRGAGRATEYIVARVIKQD